MDTPLLQIKDLIVNFYTYRGVVKALDKVNLTINRRESVGLVGETGCGKSITARSIISLLPPTGRVEGGSIELEEKNIFALSEAQLRNIRGRQVSFIFQEPKKALDPTATVGSQMEEAIRISLGVSASEARSMAPGFFTSVGLSDADRILSNYSFELSGGMAQRVMIAMAICGKPKLIIADEPTSALDVSIQAQILRLLSDIIEKYDSSLLLITHDLGVAAENCQKIAVMYAGWIVEYGNVEKVLTRPSHPYTTRLLKALPSKYKKELLSIPGMVPDLVNPPTGCRFSNRCDFADQKCRTERPPVIDSENGHLVACFKPLN